MNIFYIKIHQNIPEEYSPSSPSPNRFTPTTILLHHPSKLGVALRCYADSFWPSKEIENWISGSLIEHKVTACTLYRRFQHCNKQFKTFLQEESFLKLHLIVFFNKFPSRKVSGIFEISPWDVPCKRQPVLLVWSIGLIYKFPPLRHDIGHKDDDDDHDHESNHDDD